MPVPKKKKKKTFRGLGKNESHLIFKLDPKAWAVLEIVLLHYLR